MEQVIYEPELATMIGEVVLGVLGSGGVGFYAGHWLTARKRDNSIIPNHAAIKSTIEAMDRRHKDSMDMIKESIDSLNSTLQGLNNNLLKVAMSKGLIV